MEAIERVEEIIVSESVSLGDTAEMSCQYNGCSGDCNCDGD